MKKGKIESIMVKNQIHETQTIVETAQASLQDLKNNASDFSGITLWQNWKTECWNNSSLLEWPTGNLLRTEVHVFPDSVLCVGNHNAIANQAWATKAL